MLSICFSSSSAGKMKWMALHVSANKKTELVARFLLYSTFHVQRHTDLCGSIIDFRKSAFDECVSALHTQWIWFHVVSLVKSNSPMGNLTLRFCVTVDRIDLKAHYIVTSELANSNYVWMHSNSNGPKSVLKFWLLILVRYSMYFIAWFNFPRINFDMNIIARILFTLSFIQMIYQ